MYNRKDNVRINFDAPKSLAKLIRDHAKKQGLSIADVMRIIAKEFFTKK